MTSIEETGKNLEDATQRALKKLGTTEDKVDVEILDEGSRGFLGLGQAPAKVRVTVREVQEAPSAPAPARRRSRPRPERRGPKPERQPQAEPQRAGGGERKPKQERAARPEEEQAAKPKTQAQRPKRKPRPERKPTVERTEAPTDEQAQETQTVREETAVPQVTEEMAKKAAEAGRDVLQRILNEIQPGEASADIKSISDSQINLNIVGGDMAQVIGRHGQTIDAIQYLVGIIANKRIEGRVRIVIDAEGYRERREAALHKQALDLAKRVKESGEEAVLESLGSGERRVIHTALVDDPDVYTYSEGEEPNRHLVISPKK